jgi:hypothetical protein
VSTVIARTMKEGRIEDIAFTRNAAVKHFSKEIEATATMLATIANINRTVHLPNYNKLISEMALKCKAEMVV